MVGTTTKTPVYQGQRNWHSQTVYVPDRPVDSNKKHVWSGRLHMRPMQWHLKQHWQVLEILEKVILVPRSDTESHLHINVLELNTVFLALKSFEHLCRDQIVLVATDNTTG